MKATQIEIRRIQAMEDTASALNEVLNRLAGIEEKLDLALKSKSKADKAPPAEDEKTGK